DRQEVLGRGVAAIRQAPAQERLDDADFAGRKVHLGLEVQLELATVDRAAQALLGRELGGGRLEEFRAENANATATLGLGVEERRVSRAQQALGIPPVRREDAGAQAE